MRKEIENIFCFNLNDISIYRSELMGWSIIWIMMLHFRFVSIIPLGFIAQYGFTGVDIFLLVSGLGLYYSLDKNSGIISFYKKRLLRIFPTYYILGIFSSILIFHDNILIYLFRYTTIGFWIGKDYWEWYVPSIVILYLAAPFLKLIIDKGHAIIVCILSIAILSVTYYMVSKEVFHDKDQYFFLLYRIPAFLFGMLCAYWLKNGIKANKYYYIIMLAGIPFFAILLPRHHEIYNYKYFALTFLFPLFVYIICKISRWAPFINPLMKKVGNASLEIYLIQCIFFAAFISGSLSVSRQWHDAVTIGLIILCSLLGIVVHWAIDKSGILHLLQSFGNRSGKA